MKRTLILTKALILLAFGPLQIRADLLVYEPFYFAPVNDEVNGRLEGKNGGFGWGGPWVDSVYNSAGYAFIYDSRGNAPGLYGGRFGDGQPNWDGRINNLPQVGNYVGLSSWSSQAAGESRLNSYRPLVRSAGAMAEANGGVLWLTMGVHFTNRAFYVAPTVMLTTTDTYLAERGLSLYPDTGSGVGTALGNDFKDQTLTKDLNPIFWEWGAQAAKTAGLDVRSDAIDIVVVLKFEFGPENDTVSVWYFGEEETMDEETFNANAVSATYSIDEYALDTFSFAIDRQENAIDEIRIGTTFKDVISLPPPGPVDASVSTVEASPPSARADGSSTSTITVTLRDSIGVPVPGKSVTMANTAGPRSAVITPSNPQTTDTNGQATFTVSSSVPGTEVFTATVTPDSVVIIQTASIRFVSLPDAAVSTVVASPTAVIADGSTTASITVTLKDSAGFPIPGKNVTLANTAGPRAAVINPADAQTTDNNGQVTFTVSSSTPGTEVFSATDITDSIVLTQTASVNFVHPEAPFAINVNYYRNRPTAGSPEDPATLSGPAGGANETWNQFNTTTGTNLFATTGVKTSIGFIITAPSSWDWGAPDLNMLRSGLAFFGKGDDTTFTIVGLKPGGYYDVWLASHANNTADAERASGVWSTPNPTSSPAEQAIDGLSYLNGTTWLAGNNYVLFENVQADAEGKIVFFGDATDVGEIDDRAYRLPLNGWQLRQVTPLLVAISSNKESRGHYDFTWNSKQGRVYDLVSSHDLSQPITAWPVWDGRTNIVATPPVNRLINIPNDSSSHRFFALVEKRSTALLKADFEQDNGGFFVVGTPNDWAWGTPNSNNGGGLVVNSGNAMSARCWGTNLGDGTTSTGLIDIAAYSVLQSPVINLKSVATAELMFAAAVDVASSDVISIQLFEAGTDMLLDVLYPITVPRSANWATYGPLDISAAAGRFAYVQFVFQGSDGSRIGLYIDDVFVTGK